MVGAVLVRHEPTSAGLVRQQLTRELAACDVAPESIDDVVLVASELVGNAVRHTPPTAQTALDVNWSVDSTEVTVTVADGSQQLPARRQVSPGDTSGRGLTIIDAVARDWGVELFATGKRVWARVPIRRHT